MLGMCRGQNLCAEFNSQILELLCDFTSRRVKILHLGSIACGTDKNHCQSEEELSFKAMFQLFFENKLFQVPALKHLELILLFRAWSGHAYETCLCAF